jgi:hypothetical protein
VDRDTGIGLDWARLGKAPALPKNGPLPGQAPWNWTDHPAYHQGMERPLATTVAMPMRRLNTLNQRLTSVANVFHEHWFDGPPKWRVRLL